MQGLKNLTTHLPFLRKWLENLLHQNKRINQERGKYGIQETGAQTWDRHKKNFHDDKEEGFQNDRHPEETE